MAKGKTGHRRKKTRKFLWIMGSIMTAITLGMAAFLLILDKKENNLIKPDELLITYMSYISEQNYKKMYQMLDVEASARISEEDFIKRNSAIYEGIEVRNLTTTIISYNEEKDTVQYQTSFDTVAGNISFENEAFFIKREDGYGMVWSDSMIFPSLSSQDKVKVSTTQAKRGEILDRNGCVLAGIGVASSVGIVPGELKDKDDAIRDIAELLGMELEEIEKKLSAGWVKEDSFVPIKTLRKVEEIILMSIEPEEEMLKEFERQQQLLAIPGVIISDTEVRNYPLGEAAAHLIGYVQNVTAEDLEKHAKEGYTASSVIGRSGSEALFERELKGQNGCEIYIVDSEGNKKEELANRMVQHGKSVKLTIDAELQKTLYEQFQEDKSCSVAMNPYTGEVLALVIK